MSRESARCRCALPLQLALGISIDDRRFARVVLRGKIGQSIIVGGAWRSFSRPPCESNIGRLASNLSSCTRRPRYLTACGGLPPSPGPALASLSLEKAPPRASPQDFSSHCLRGKWVEAALRSHGVVVLEPRIAEVGCVSLCISWRACGARSRAPFVARQVAVDRLLDFARAGRAGRRAGLCERPWGP